MKHLHFARSLSIVCIVGATIQIIYGLLSIPFPFYDPNTHYGWDEALWAVANIGMIGGALGLLALNVARPRWLAVLGAALSVHCVGLADYCSSECRFLRPTDSNQYSSHGVWHGGTWCEHTVGETSARLASLDAVACRRMPARYSADLLSINLPLHVILLGLWGIPWLLVGYVVFSFATKQKQVVLGKASAVVP